MKVISMGDGNAVDIAQVTHQQVLEDRGLLKPGDGLVYGSALPSSEIMEGLYIDDHLCLALLHLGFLENPFGRDMEIARNTYSEGGLPVSHEKGFGFCEDCEKPVGSQVFIA